MNILRSLAALVVGILVTGLVVVGVETLGHQLFPAKNPVAMDPGDVGAMRDFVRSLPTGALGFVVAAWTLGAFFGSVAAIRIARSHQAILAWVIGGLTLAMAGVAMWQIPHPAWMMAAGVVLPLVAVGVAVRWLVPRPLAPGPHIS